MQKIIIGIIFTLAFIFIPNNVYASDKVTIYIFRGDECPHCEEALEYINSKKDSIDANIEIATYEVWRNQNNSKLQDEVAKKLNIDTEAEDYGVPLIVIGEEYIKGYSGTQTYNEIMTKAESYINNDKYKDVVSATEKELIKNNKDLKFDKKYLKDIYAEPNKVVTIIVYTIFGLIVLGFIAMMVFSRK